MIAGYPVGAAPNGASSVSAYVPPVDPGGGTPNPQPGTIDATKVPASRRVVFEGSKRVVSFEGSIRKVRF